MDKTIKKVIEVLKICILSAGVMCSVLFLYTVFYNGATETRIKAGADKSKVVLVQEKLKELGLYDGECDGVYDVGTADAVRRFQEYNGIYSNGVCDNETLILLGIDTYTFDEFELDSLAKLIECEAGEYDLQTMTAVGAVVMNRVKSKSFPDSVLQVIFSGNSFESVANGKIYKAKASELAYRAAEDAMMGFDPTDGALYVMRGETGDRIITLHSGDLFFGR